MQNLREFFASSSGLVPARQGLALGWVISALTGITILLGAKEGEAGACERRTYDDCGYDAWCDDRTDGAEPIKCCVVTERRDCSFSTGNCSCVA